MPAPRPVLPRWVAPAAALPWAVWAVLRATGTERGFPLVPVLSFTPQAAAASALPLGLGLVARSPAGVALSVCSGTALAVAALEHRERPQPGSTEPVVDGLRLATVSLRRGVVPAATVLDLVRRYDVDVLSVQELTPRALRRLRGGGLERLLPHAHVLLAGPGRPASAAGAVWSRRPITGRAAVPGSFEQPTARLQTAAGTVEITAVHPRPPAVSPAQVRDWTADLARLPAPSPEVLRVLAGDFNATPDHAAFRAVVGSGYLDAAAAVGRGRDWTWQAVGLRRPRLALDHVLVDPRIRVVRVEFAAVRGSDHRSIVADLEFTAPLG